MLFYSDLAYYWYIVSNITPWKYSFELWQEFGPQCLSFHSFKAILHPCQILDILDWLKEEPILLPGTAMITLTSHRGRVSLANQVITDYKSVFSWWVEILSCQLTSRPSISATLFSIPAWPLKSGVKQRSEFSFMATEELHKPTYFS